MCADVHFQGQEPKSVCYRTNMADSYCYSYCTRIDYIPEYGKHDDALQIKRHIRGARLCYAYGILLGKGWCALVARLSPNISRCWLPSQLLSHHCNRLTHTFGFDAYQVPGITTAVAMYET